MRTIFGGDTGVSYEQLKAQQEAARAIQQRSMQGSQNVPEGIRAIGLALMGRQAQKRADGMRQDYLAQYGGQIPEEEMAKIQQARLLDILRG
jgi:hypothetical protein